MEEKRQPPLAPASWPSITAVPKAMSLQSQRPWPYQKFTDLAEPSETDIDRTAKLDAWISENAEQDDRDEQKKKEQISSTSAPNFGHNAVWLRAHHGSSSASTPAPASPVPE